MKKAFFIHIPKTAGSSIQEVCRAHDIYVDTLNQTWKNIDSQDKQYSDYYKFAFVRNPWDRMISCWAMFSTWRTADWLPKFSFRDFLQAAFATDDMEKISVKRLWKINPESENERTFLVQEYIKSIRNHSCPYTHPFYKLYDKNTKELLVDYVGRFESLQEDFDKLCDIIGIHKSVLPHKTKSMHNHYREYYTDETREMVRDKYKEDIELFRYEFGEY